jgi:hypothetical protein
MYIGLELQKDKPLWILYQVKSVYNNGLKQWQHDEGVLELLLGHFSCLCFLDMIPCLFFLIRSPCLRCIVCEMLNSPNDQVWPTRCLGLSLGLVFFLLCTTSLSFCAALWICVVMLVLHPEELFFDYAYWKMLVVSHVVFLDEKWYTSIYRLFIMFANWHEGNGYWIHTPSLFPMITGYLIHITNLLGVGKCIMEWA